MKNFELFFTLYIIVLLIALTYFWIDGMDKDSQKAREIEYFDIQRHEKVIVQSIKNNATINDLERILYNLSKDSKAYSNSNDKKGYLIRLNQAEKNVNSVIISFDIVLKDMRSYFIMKDSIVQMEIVRKIDHLILEFKETSPFASLEKNQQYFFTNLRNTLDTNYVLIENDMNEIVNELQVKNSLVTQYFSNANSSYKNSKSAILIASISLLLAIINYIINFRKRNKSSS